MDWLDASSFMIRWLYRRRNCGSKVLKLFLHQTIVMYII